MVGNMGELDPGSFVKNTLSVSLVFWLVGVVILAISFFAQQYLKHSLLVGYTIFFLCFLLGLKYIIEIDWILNKRV